MMTPDEIRALAHELSETNRKARPKRWHRLVKEVSNERHRLRIRLVDGAAKIIPTIDQQAVGLTWQIRNFWKDLYDAYEACNQALEWVDQHEDEWLLEIAKEVFDLEEIPDPDLKEM
jgi:hypothetical protein